MGTARRQSQSEHTRPAFLHAETCARSDSRLAAIITCRNAAQRKEGGPQKAYATIGPKGKSDFGRNAMLRHHLARKARIKHGANPPADVGAKRRAVSHFQ